MPWRHGLRLALQGTVILGLAALCLLVLAWLTLQWGILPHIEDWRPAMERHASKAVGVPVRIGHIAVRSSGWVPALELRDVVLLDPSGPEALRLPHVSAALSARSLLVLEPRLSQLYIEDAHLVVRRDTQGRLHVAGIDVPERPASTTSLEDTGAIDWFFGQQEFVLRHGSVRWIDEQRGAPALELGDVDFVVRNGLRSHALRLDATPPVAWGERFSLRLDARQPLLARSGDWRRWSGTMYADLAARRRRAAAGVHRPAVRARARAGRAAAVGRLPDQRLARPHGRRAPARRRPASRARGRAARDRAGLGSADRDAHGHGRELRRRALRLPDGRWRRLAEGRHPRGVGPAPDAAQARAGHARARRATRAGPRPPSSGAPTMLWDSDHRSPAGASRPMPSISR